MKDHECPQNTTGCIVENNYNKTYDLAMEYCDGYGFQTMYVQVNYCPFCGIKLDKEEL